MSIMVSGAAGHLGRAVIAELKERVGAASIVALSREPGKIADLGVPTRHADFDEPGTLATAFAGADRLLLISTDKVGSRVEQHGNAIKAAVTAGVGHIFYTSGPRASDLGHPTVWIPEHRGTEEMLSASGLRYTALRNNIYTDMLLFSVPQAVASGVHADNGGDGGISYVTRDDLAAATATILTDPADPGRILELTGPAAVSGADLAAILSTVTGKPIRFQPLTDDQYGTGLTAGGLPPSVVEIAVSVGRGTREGYFGLVTDLVARYLGRTPTSVAEFLTANKAAFAV